MTIFFPINWANHNLAYYLKSGPEDGLFTKTAKLGAGFVSFSAVTVLGVFETATLATITTIAFIALKPLTTDFTKRKISTRLHRFALNTLNSLCNRVRIADQATLSALKGIFGYCPTITVEAPEIKVEETNKVEETKEEPVKEENTVTVIEPPQPSKDYCKKTKQLKLEKELLHDKITDGISKASYKEEALKNKINTLKELLKNKDKSHSKEITELKKQLETECNKRFWQRCLNPFSYIRVE